MRKFTIIAAIFILCAVLVMPQANAEVVPDGSYIRLVQPTWNTSNGGQFDVYLPPNSTNIYFSTFCIEINEYVNPPETLWVGTVTDKIKQNSSGSDIALKGKAAFLYHQFRTSGLGSLGFVYGNLASTVALQRAIWYEQYGTAGGYGEHNAYAVYAETSGWADNYIGDVRVINLYDDDNHSIAKQDMLTLIPGTQVPEPMTMLLLGLGLVGLAGLRRKE